MLVIDGEPPRKNRRHAVVLIAGHGALADHPDFRAWRGELALTWRLSREPPITSGVWRVDVVAWWSSERHLEDLSFGRGDVDAPVSAILDALQQCKAIDDDVRFDDGHMYRRHDKLRPRTVVILTELAPDGSLP